MKIFNHPYKALITVAVASVLLAACTTPTKPDGASSARSRLIQLQSDPELASRAPLAIKEADIAVTAAEMPQTDKILGAHLVFLADRRVAIAQAQAEGRLAVDQRKTLGDERDAMRLQARTQEADAANRRATLAQADASDQKQRAEAAISQADAANAASAEAQRSALEMQRQLDELQAKVTDRGIVLTLGDVLFATGTANLNTGVSSNLGKLAGFLVAHPERNVLIEGYTDSVGSDEYNQALSERRAEAVKAYLIGQGVNSTRLTATGKGEAAPVGDNASNTGRQQNRRVEVVIENSLVSAR